MEDEKRRRVYEKTYSSNYRGVTHEGTNRWRATIFSKSLGKVFIGNFKTEKEAAEAYNAKAMEIHGEKAKLNKIVENDENVVQKKYRPRHIPVPENEFRYFAFALLSVMKDEMTPDMEKMVLRVAAVSEYVDSKDPRYRTDQLKMLYLRLSEEMKKKFLEHVPNKTGDLYAFLKGLS